MTGKCYYITTHGAWQQHASRFATSHFVVLAAPSVSPTAASATAICANPPSGEPAPASAKSSHADAPGVSVVSSGAAAQPCVSLRGGEQCYRAR